MLIPRCPNDCPMTRSVTFAAHYGLALHLRTPRFMVSHAPQDIAAAPPLGDASRPAARTAQAPEPRLKPRPAAGARGDDPLGRQLARAVHARRQRAVITGPLLQRTPADAAQALKDASYAKVSKPQLNQWLSKSSGTGTDKKTNAVRYGVTLADHDAISVALAALIQQEATAAAEQRARERAAAQTAPVLDAATRAAQLMSSNNGRAIGPFPDAGPKVADAKATCYYDASGKFCVTPDRDEHAGAGTWKLYQAVATSKGKNDGWMRIDTLHPDGRRMGRG